MVYLPDSARSGRRFTPFSRYTKLQTRIGTASDFFLDIIAADFFGTRLARRNGELDQPFRARIRANIFMPRATRAAVSAVVESLTGRIPVIFEPAYTHDTGAYGTPAKGGGNFAYGAAGGWGSLVLPFQFFMVAYRPLGNGTAQVAGYGETGGANGMPGGYGVGAIEFGSLALAGAQITDAEIYASIAATIPAASSGWTRVADPPLVLPLTDQSGVVLSDELANLLNRD